MSMHVLLCFIGLICCQTHGRHKNFIQNEFTLAMTDMVVNTGWIYEDCFNGELSDIQFDIEYTFGTKTSCRHKADLVVPVEWNSGIEALATYGETANHQYSGCILNRTCDNINMSDWRQLALEQYRACEHCDSEDVDDESCKHWTTEVDGANVTTIIKSMFIVAKFTCKIDTVHKDALVVPVVHGDRVHMSNLGENGFRCPSSRHVHITHITEQASNTRRKVRNNNSQLVQKIQTWLETEHSGLVSFREQDWSIFGNYFWGLNETKRTSPSELIIQYECTN